MKRIFVSALVWLTVLSGTLCSQTQAAAGTTAIPTLINFSGTLNDGKGKALTGKIGVTFLVYKDEQGGAPLWLETQSVSVDKSGRYTVMLGSTHADGLPTDMFSSGEARWLAVQAEGQPESPRILLLSVPYALKAGDASTLGGLPASAFVLAAPASSTTPTVGSDTAPDSTDSPVSSSSAAPASSNVTTNGGTVNAVPLFTTATNIQNSLITQTGTTAVNVVGKLNAPATGTATSTAGRNSQAHAFTASAFNSGTAAAVAQTFQLQAEPVGNNTTAPSGSLNLLFGSGTTAPAETGFKISSKGLITFATGQTFPGTGTITGVTTTAGSGLTGGGTTGTLSLKLLSTCTTNQILKWNGTAWACAADANSGTITGVTAGTDLTGGGTTGKVTLNLDTTKVPQLATANTFAGAQTINNNLTVSTSSSVDALDVLGGTTNNGIYGQTASPAGVAVYGQSVDTSFAGAGIGVFGTSLSTFGYGIIGSGASTSSGGIYGLWAGQSSQNRVISGVSGDSTYGTGVSGTTDGPGPGMYASSDSGRGLWASSNTSSGVYAESNNEIGMSAESFGVAGSYSLLAPISNTGIGFGNAGAWGDTGKAGGFGVLGTVDDGNAFWGRSNSLNHETLYIENDAASSASGTSFAARFAGPGSATWCEIYGNPNGTNTGELLCTGAKSAAVPVDGNRMVRLYAVEAADNWFEDAGGGQLSNGRAIVRLDPTFAQTVNGGLDYRVFVTANGECEGLYVSSKTAQGFEVRELRGGHSNVTFDYRIMARRRGFENVRLEDVTAHFVQARRNTQQLEARVAAGKLAARNRPEPRLLRKPKGTKPSIPVHAPLTSKAMPVTAKTKTN